MWRHKNIYAIGGLENIGFDQADALTVLSSQGVGLFNCLTGERFFRQETSWWENYEPMAGTISGYDILEGSTIRICGLDGPDFLSKETRDGWILEYTGPVPDDPPFEKYQVNKIFLAHQSRGHHEFICQDGACELRAFGFSATGNSLVVATSCNLVIWSRV
ncbi:MULTISPECIES: hypothetical protein [unclassified Chitinophaga]|uniref:hypothetical protein n=1 Tax=unclassified Chitinophaga TaxID=2619133 RepID=UPI00300FEB04